MNKALSKLLIDGREYDLAKMVQHRREMPEIIIERHQLMDPRIPGSLMIRYDPPLEPGDSFFNGPTIFLEYDRAFYALAGRADLYTYLDSHQPEPYTGLKVSKVMLKKFLIGNSVTPLVENQQRMRSDERRFDRASRTERHSVPAYPAGSSYSSHHYSSGDSHEASQSRSGDSGADQQRRILNSPYGKRKPTVSR